GEGAEALLTTPGAGKWYRSSGAWARQRVTLSAARASCVEWLPQETILFDASLADISFEARLEGDARLIAWDIVCLGRRGSGERFASGRCRTHARIYRDGRLLWWERARIGGEDRLAASPAGLAGASVFATFMLAAPEIDDAWLQSAREASPGSGIGGVTRLPGLLLARYRGDSSEDARDYFTRLWSCLREPVTGHPAVRPRIWST
ncbi:MAG TPA: urease accessory protein UreD, partial [Usitatibacter sp.]|nr:urease accessory protein UreD [Usitatibacter sp.]